MTRTLFMLWKPAAYFLCTIWCSLAIVLIFVYVNVKRFGTFLCGFSTVGYTQGKVVSCMSRAVSVRVSCL
jgi:hypothetical protein